MKLIKVMMLILLAVGLLVPLSCSRVTKTDDKAGAGPGLVFPTPTAPLPPQPGRATFAPSIAAETVATERLIVRTGDMSLVVKDVVGSRDEIGRMAERENGYVVSSQIYGEEQEKRGYISIRIPDDKFESILDELRGLAIRVNSESTSSRDVTQEYIDLQGRLRNAEATEAQYLKLLERAQVEEAIRIYELLHQVRQEIEQIKGQIKYLEQTTSMSLINVQLQPAATAGRLAPVWSALEVIKSAIRGMVTLGQWLANAAIWVLVFLPVWGTILGLIIWRLRRGKKTAQKAS